MNFFIKYKVHINSILLIFWSYILCEGIMATNFSVQKLIVPMVFIIINLFNIYKGIHSNKQKSEK